MNSPKYAEAQARGLEKRIQNAITKIPYVGIPDPDGKIGKLYGQEWNLIKLGRMPALFIVDQKGTIVFAQYANNMADIPENGKLFQILEKLK